MAEFPKRYINRYENGAGRIMKMFLEDGTVLGPDAEPISGPGFEKKQAEKKPVSRAGLRKAAKSARRLAEED